MFAGALTELIIEALRQSTDITPKLIWAILKSESQNMFTF